MRTGRIRRSEGDIASVSTHNRAPRFKIIDESENYIVVDKPAFLLTHPTKPDQRTTLWKQLRELLAFEIANGGQVSIVNRLDRETSGLVLVAKNAGTARRFGLLMQEQRFDKEYLAIVWGWPEWETKIVNAPLDRQGKHQTSAIWLKQTIHPKGAEAITEFRVECRFERPPHLNPLPRGEEVRKDSSPLSFPSPSGRGSNNASPARTEAAGEGKFSLVRAIPKTGRTHQIRVHLSSLSHPIVGDKIYGPDEKFYLKFIETGWTPDLEQHLLLPRHALHSAKLAIENELEWAAQLPQELAMFCSSGL
jgi:23S rRNA pseudouridine1911/1915/1917 synthase